MSFLNDIQKRSKPNDDAAVVSYGRNGAGVNYSAKSEAARATSGWVGLVNQGATCYLNSLLQCLHAIDAFRLNVFNWRPSGEASDAEDAAISGALQSLFAELSLSDRYAAQTTPLTRAFGWETGEAWVQHDVSEAQTVLLDALEAQGLKQCSELMTGSQEHYVHCTCCGNTSARREQFINLLVPVTGHASMDSSFRGFLAAETLEGDNAYACDTCIAAGRGKQKAVKGTRLPKGDLPPVLFVQLARFEFCMITLGRKKVTDPLSPQVAIDMRPYCHPAVTPGTTNGQATTASASAVVREAGEQGTPPSSDGGASGAGAVPQEREDPLAYELSALLMHTGGANAGHYFAYVRRPAVDVPGLWPRRQKVQQVVAWVQSYAEGRGSPSSPLPFTLAEVNECTREAALLAVGGGIQWVWLHFNDSTVDVIDAESLPRALGQPDPAPVVLPASLVAILCPPPPSAPPGDFTGAETAVTASSSTDVDEHPLWSNKHSVTFTGGYGGGRSGAGAGVTSRANRWISDGATGAYMLCFQKASLMQDTLQRAHAAYELSVSEGSAGPSSCLRLGAQALPAEMRDRILAENARQVALREEEEQARSQVSVDVFYARDALQGLLQACSISSASLDGCTEPLHRPGRPFCGAGCAVDWSQTRVEKDSLARLAVRLSETEPCTVLLLQAVRSAIRAELLTRQGTLPAARHGHGEEAQEDVLLMGLRTSVAAMAVTGAASEEPVNHHVKSQGSPVAHDVVPDLLTPGRTDQDDVALTRGEAGAGADVADVTVEALVRQVLPYVRMRRFNRTSYIPLSPVLEGSQCGAEGGKGEGEGGQGGGGECMVKDARLAGMYSTGQPLVVLEFRESTATPWAAYAEGSLPVFLVPVLQSPTTPPDVDALEEHALALLVPPSPLCGKSTVGTLRQAAAELLTAYLLSLPDVARPEGISLPLDASQCRLFTSGRAKGSLKVLAGEERQLEASDAEYMSAGEVVVVEYCPGSSETLSPDCATSTSGSALWKLADEVAHSITVCINYPIQTQQQGSSAAGAEVALLQLYEAVCARPEHCVPCVLGGGRGEAATLEGIVAQQRSVALLQCRLKVDKRKPARVLKESGCAILEHAWQLLCGEGSEGAGGRGGWGWPMRLSMKKYGNESIYLAASEETNDAVTVSTFLDLTSNLYTGGGTYWSASTVAMDSNGVKHVYLTPGQALEKTQIELHLALAVPAGTGEPVVVASPDDVSGRRAALPGVFPLHASVDSQVAWEQGVVRLTVERPAHKYVSVGPMVYLRGMPYADAVTESCATYMPAFLSVSDMDVRAAGQVLLRAEGQQCSETAGEMEAAAIIYDAGKPFLASKSLGNNLQLRHSTAVKHGDRCLVQVLAAPLPPIEGSDQVLTLARLEDGPLQEAIEWAKAVEAAVAAADAVDPLPLSPVPEVGEAAVPVGAMVVSTHASGPSSAAASAMAALGAVQRSAQPIPRLLHTEELLLSSAILCSRGRSGAGEPRGEGEEKGEEESRSNRHTAPLPPASLTLGILASVAAPVLALRPEPLTADVASALPAAPTPTPAGGRYPSAGAAGGGYSTLTAAGDTGDGQAAGEPVLGALPTLCVCRVYRTELERGGLRWSTLASKKWAPVALPAQGEGGGDTTHHWHALDESAAENSRAALDEYRNPVDAIPRLDTGVDYNTTVSFVILWATPQQVAGMARVWRAEQAAAAAMQRLSPPADERLPGLTYSYNESLYGGAGGGAVSGGSGSRTSANARGAGVNPMYAGKVTAASSSSTHSASPSLAMVPYSALHGGPEENPSNPSAPAAPLPLPAVSKYKAASSGYEERAFSIKARPGKAGGGAGGTPTASAPSPSPVASSSLSVGAGETPTGTSSTTTTGPLSSSSTSLVGMVPAGGAPAHSTEGVDVDLT